MKLKYRPEDFRVEEISTARPGRSGRYTFYRLSKRDMGTIEAVEAVRRRWNLAERQVSYAGLKDRHAVTEQFLTIGGGPWKSLETTKFQLEPIGRLEKPYSSAELLGNRFTLVLRDLSAAELDAAVDALEPVRQIGLPNYFDDQRFGSVGASGAFVAHAWLLGDHERALKLALAEPNASDRAATKAEKAVLRRHWGNWPEAKAALPRSSARSIVTYLVDHPSDHRGAFARIRREHRMLYFSSFQSHLWNLLLARSIEDAAGGGEPAMVPLRLGAFPFPRRLDEGRARELSEARLPLPSARTPLPEGRPGELAEAVLQEFGLAWRDLRVKHLRDVFFSKGARTCMFPVHDLTFSAVDDEHHPGRGALELSFRLGKGSYATILVKRLSMIARPR